MNTGRKAKKPTKAEIETVAKFYAFCNDKDADPKVTAELIKSLNKTTQGKAELMIKIARATTGDEWLDFQFLGKVPTIKLSANEMEAIKGGLWGAALAAGALAIGSAWAYVRTAPYNANSWVDQAYAYLNEE